MTSPEAAILVHRHEPDLFNEAVAGVLLLLLWCVGALAMLPVTATLMQLWHEDPLRSFGMVIPFTSLLLIVRAWHRCTWQWTGSMWGLLPTGIAVLGARVLGDSLVTYRIGNHAIGLLQPGFFFFLYGSGLVILLGGRLLWRASLFPLLLLFCVNPVPHLFSQFVDLPLQAASAGTARAFAHALGLHPTGEQLQMLFAPRFGMIIVPGCNGIRGSVTMGYLMLLLGYWKGYRPVRLAVYVLAAVALGYMLNLVRLCVLVLYYWAGIHIQTLRPHGEGIDYLIGGSLFLLIAALAGFLLFRGRSSRDSNPTYPHLPWNLLLTSGRIKALALLLLLCSLPEIPTAFARMRAPGDGFTSVPLAMQSLPERVGQWQRGTFSFEKQEADGQIIWIWAPYTRPDGLTVDMGVWLSPLQHFALNSRRIHGDTPTWTGTLDTFAAHEEPVHLSVFRMNDEFTAGRQTIPTLFAETTCLPGRCSDATVGFGKRGLSIAMAPVSAGSNLRLSLLFRVQVTPGRENSAENASAEAAMQDLIGSFDLRTLTHQLGTR